jgi:hypothetical protein
MTTLELEDLEGNTYTETIPKYPSAKLRNECEALFNAKVKATGSGEEGSIENAMQAISEQKDKVTEWCNKNHFNNDLGPDRIAPPSQDKLMREYAEYIKGVEVEQKKSQDQTTDESETGSEPTSNT